MAANINHKAITEETAKQLVQKSYELAKKPVYHIQKNQVVAGIFASLGLIIFALGVENFISSIPELSSPLVDIGLGLFLLIISGLFLKKLF